jgi:hypothetical protein
LLFTSLYFTSLHFLLFIAFSFWYNAPTLLPTGATVEMEMEFHLNREMEMEFHLNRGIGRQQYRCIVPKAVYKVKKCS